MKEEEWIFSVVEVALQLTDHMQWLKFMTKAKHKKLLKWYNVNIFVLCNLRRSLETVEINHIFLTLSSSPRHNALNLGRSICSINFCWFRCPDSVACAKSVRFLWNWILWFLKIFSLCWNGGSSWTGFGKRFGPFSPFKTRSSC